MEDTSAAIYSEAKSEYTKQLVFNFQPVLLRFFLDRYTEAKASPSVSSKAKSALSEFQDSLSQIPEWNLDKVQRETGSLIQSIHCDYMDDLITAVFIAHTKILSAIRLHAKPRRKINITVPKPEHFMHRAMSECSRLLWSSVYLFSDTVSSLDRQKNMNDVNRFLEEGILQAIRNLLPVKSILRDSLQEEEDDGIHIAQPETPNDLISEHVDTSESEVVPVTPVTPVEPVTPVTPLALLEPVTPVAPTENLPSLTPTESLAPLTPLMPIEPLVSTPVTTPISTLIVDTEKTVGFTGMDSVFGDGGHAELRPMIDEGSDEFKILGESEELDLNDIENIDTPAFIPEPLGSDDYETI